MNLSIIPVIEKTGDGFIASNDPATDWGFGTTKDEAIKDLLVAMTESLEILESERGNLGPLMKRELKLLNLHIHTTSTCIAEVS